MTKFVKILGANISYQALTTLIVGYIAAIVAVFAGLPGIVIGIVLIIVTSINAYSINCTIVGKCEVFSYILTVFMIIYSFALVGAGFYFKRKQGQQIAPPMMMGGRRYK